MKAQKNTHQITLIRSPVHGNTFRGGMTVTLSQQFSRICQNNKISKSWRPCCAYALQFEKYFIVLSPPPQINISKYWYDRISITVSQCTRALKLYLLLFKPSQTLVVLPIHNTTLKKVFTIYVLYIYIFRTKINFLKICLKISLEFVYLEINTTMVFMKIF